MIRLKNNVLPVWFQWDGDETSLERAKQTIIEDIRLNGFDHYTGFADITDEPTGNERGWDGSTEGAELEAARKEQVKDELIKNAKANDSKPTIGISVSESTKDNTKKKPMSKFTEEKTAKSTQQSAS